MSAVTVAIWPTLAAGEPLTWSDGGDALRLDIAEAEVLTVEGLVSLHILLTESSGDALAKASERAVGRTVTLSLCGPELARAVVRDRIDGRVVLDMPGISAANAVRDVGLGNATCDALAPHFSD